MLAQGNVDVRAGNFLMLCAVSAVVFAAIAVIAAGNPLFGWAGGVLGFFIPYAYASHMRTKRFQKFEEKFPEAIDTLARAVRAGHAFTTALKKMIANEVSEPVAGRIPPALRRTKIRPSRTRRPDESRRPHSPGRRQVLRHSSNVAARNRRQSG